MADLTADDPFEEIMTLAEKTWKELLFVRYPRAKWYSEAEYADVETTLKSLGARCRTHAQIMQRPERTVAVDALVKEIDHFYRSFGETGQPVFAMPRIRAAVKAIEPLRDQWQAWLRQQNAPPSMADGQPTNASALPPTGPAPEPTILALKRPSRIVVDLDAMTVAVDGKATAVKNKMALRWLQVLIEHPDKWISVTELRKYDPSFPAAIRSERLKQHLPPQIQLLIESATGRARESRRTESTIFPRTRRHKPQDRASARTGFPTSWWTCHLTPPRFRSRLSRISCLRNRKALR